MELPGKEAGATIVAVRCGATTLMGLNIFKCGSSTTIISMAKK